MAKIIKNRSDREMFANWQEEATFENMLDGRQETTVAKKTAKVEDKGWQSFFTDEFKESVGKALLELKVTLYKQGVVDFKLQTAVKDNQIILTAVPKKKR
ncbi:MAG: hypothetical protein E6713_11320 [Sporomusaceae bacterium]|nr:hypothetical protein [Sporomusaceae bacterium]